MCLQRKLGNDPEESHLNLSELPCKPMKTLKKTFADSASVQQYIRLKDNKNNIASHHTQAVFNISMTSLLSMLYVILKVVVDGSNPDSMTIPWTESNYMK